MELKLMINAIRKFTSLLSRISQPDSTTREGVLTTGTSFSPATTAAFPALFVFWLCFGEPISTLFPPSPSTILPVLESRTLRCSSPPSTESNTLPSAPQTVSPTINVRDSSSVHGRPPLPPPLQNGTKNMAVVTMTMLPSTPAASPVSVTPPFVPGGTLRRVGDVMRRGGPRARMPSSEEKVSAATAA